MDKAVEKPRGLSKASRVGLAAAAGVTLLSLAVIPALRRWTRAERTVPLAALRIGTVERGDLVRDASAQGKIVAALHPTLFSPAQGIVSLKVKAGDTVKKGQLLAHIERPELTSRSTRRSRRQPSTAAACSGRQAHPRARGRRRRTPRTSTFSR